LPPATDKKSNWHTNDNQLKMKAMFDIRKIQEQVIFNAVHNESDESTADGIVNYPSEDNPNWGANTMQRLEEKFDAPTVKRIRMNCQCGYVKYYHLSDQ
jgi:hypothetical protein